MVNSKGRGIKPGALQARLDKVIAADERHDEVYKAESLVEGRQIAEKVLASFPTCPIPEIRRLGRTPRQ